MPNFKNMGLMVPMKKGVNGFGHMGMWDILVM